jgi:hypothetical protein
MDLAQAAGGNPGPDVARLWRSAAQCLLGGIGVALLTFVCFRLRVNQVSFAAGRLCLIRREIEHAN